MKKITIDLLNQLSIEELFRKNKVVLVGGTALSILCNHRLSEDLDFLFSKKLPKEDISLLINKLKAVKIPFDNFSIDSFDNEGADIDDYHQKYLINGVKVDFFKNPGSILEKDIPFENPAKYRDYIKLANTNSIFKMKSLLFMERIKVRDLFDLKYLIETNNHTLNDYTFEKMIDIIKQYKITYTDDMIIDRILSMKEDIDDEGLESLLPGSIPKFKDLKDYFVNETIKYRSNKIDLTLKDSIGDR